MSTSTALLLAAAAGGATWLVARTEAGAAATRRVLRVLVRTVYSIRVEGSAHVPRHTGALLVANHVSYADAFLVGSCVERAVRFLMHRAFFAHPLVGAFARWMGAIPIASGESQAERERSLGEAADALRRGELVAIFAEGRITRTGALLGFRRGLETIARTAGAPIVPLALDEVWGSIFSFEGGRALTKWPRRLPYRVRVSIGAPLPSDAPAHRVRDALSELLALSAERRALAEPDLARAFVRCAQEHRNQPALIDSAGRVQTYGELLESALALAAVLRERLGSARWTAVLVPDAASAVELHLALALAGRAALALLPRQDRASAVELVRRAAPSHVIASAEGLRQLGITGAEWPAGVDSLDLAELREAAAHLPTSPVRARLAGAQRTFPRAGDPAVALATSGTSGAVRAPILSHAAIASNARALAQVAQVGPGDVVAAALPFAHAYGFTVTLWAPLMTGAAVLLAGAQPDAHEFARLVREHRPTVLVGTPSLFEAWREHMVRADVARVRLAICGGEHLPAWLASAWKERLGVDLLEGYGATELGPVVCANLPDVELGGVLQHNQQPGTVGRPLPGVAVRVVRSAGGELADPDELGRILVRGPGRMLGYLGEPEANAGSAPGGWYDSGDVGALDRDGFLTLVDRRERFTARAGALVPHTRIEEALRAQVPLGAGEIAVVSRPDASGVAVVHSLRGADLESVRAGASTLELAAELLAPCSQWIRVERLPRLASGKLDLRALESLLGSGRAD